MFFISWGFMMIVVNHGYNINIHQPYVSQLVWSACHALGVPISFTLCFAQAGKCVLEKFQQLVKQYETI